MAAFDRPHQKNPEPNPEAPARTEMRWQRVRSLFDSLAELRTGDRLERLRLLDDRELAAELKDLLDNYDFAGSHFLVSNAGFTIPSPKSARRTYAFQPGEILANRFLIVRPVGRGGMGDVYEAQDTKSGSRVALKCIGGGAPSDDQTIHAVRREILSRKIADPNVCRVHDLFEHSTGSETAFLLSMEFIDGETLEQRLARTGALPFSQAASLAFQLLSGIAAAHRAGVIHRDLKPGNIMLARGIPGQPERLVITDFGIAQLQTPEGATTVANTIAGTFEYMAPEQLLGENNSTSDIYTAGLIIFEMLAGRKPFDDDPLKQALRRMIEPIPRLRSVATNIPFIWDRVVSRCLQRNPQRRFQSAEEIAAVLRGDSWNSGIAGALWWSRRRWRMLTATLAGAVIVLALGARALIVSGNSGSQGVSLSPATTGGGLTMYSAISKDGRWLAYASDRDSESNLDLWVQKVGDESTRRRITSDGLDTSCPSFSDDGSKLVFRWEREGGGLYTVDLPDGRPHLLVREGQEGRFSPDGESVVYWTGEQAEHPILPSGIYLVAYKGGASRQLASGFASASNPVFLPDGRHILFEGVREPDVNYEKSADWHVLDLQTGTVQGTGALDGLRNLQLRRYNRLGNFFGNKLLFSARSVTAANIYQYRFDLDKFKVVGNPEQLTFSTALLDSPFVTQKGMLAVTNSAGSLNIWQLPLSGSGPARRLTTSLHYDTHPTVSTDGLAIAFGRTLGRERDIWLKTPAGERPLVTTKNEETYWPVIRGDGSEVAYSAVRESTKESTHSVFIVRTKDAAVEKLCDSCGDPLHFSRDGSLLLMFHGTPSRIVVLDRRTRRVQVVAQSSGDIAEAQFSSDDRHIAFRETTGSNRSRIVIAPLEAHGSTPASRWITVAEDTAWNEKPHWPEDGRSIYFLSKRDGFPCIWAQRLDTRMRPIQGPRLVRHFHSHTFSPLETSRIAFNFAIARGNLITNPAVVYGNVWTGRMADNP